MSGCTIKDATQLMIKISTAGCEWKSSWHNIAELMYKCQMILDRVLPLITHFHKAHLHPLYGFKNHNPISKDTKKHGIMKPCFKLPAIFKLYYELWHGIDRDHNDLIYGKDFIIDDDDIEKPYNLKLSEISAKLIVGKLPYKSTRKISWESYLNSINEKSREFPSTLPGRLIQEAILKRKINPTVGNCSKEIYGVTFIIDPEDPEKPQYLINLEKEINLIPPKKKMKYSEFIKNCTDYQTINPDDVISKKKEDCSYVCTRLVGEWLKGYDIDNNGKVYGKDFYFADLEPNKCSCLRDIEYDIDWNPPDDIIEYTWEDFLNTFPDKNPDDRGDY